MLKAITLCLEAQHFRREGKEVLGIEAQPDHRQKRRDQEEEHKRTDEHERVVPKNLPRRVIDRNTGTVFTAANPVGEPAHRDTDEETAKQATKTTENQTNNTKHNAGTKGLRFAFDIGDYLKRNKGLEINLYLLFEHL